MPAVQFSGGVAIRPQFAAARLVSPVVLSGELEVRPAFGSAFRAIVALEGGVQLAPALGGSLAIRRELGGGVEAGPGFGGQLGVGRRMAGGLGVAPGFGAAFAVEPVGLFGTVGLSPEFGAAMRVGATLAGGVAIEPRFGAAFAFVPPAIRAAGTGEVPGVVNYVPNPSAEPGLDGWADFGSAATTRVEGDAWTGDWHVQAVVPGGASGSVVVETVPGIGTAGGWWAGTVALDVPPEALVDVRYLLFYADGTDGQGEAAVVAPTAGWLPVLPPPAEADAGKALDRVELHVGIENTNDPGGDAATVRIDGVQTAPYAPGYDAYADGDAGEGHAWTGAPHASPSFRQTLPEDA